MLIIKRVIHRLGFFREKSLSRIPFHDSKGRNAHQQKTHNHDTWNNPGCSPVRGVNGDRVREVEIEFIIHVFSLKFGEGMLRTP
jgi:hypothetical protein